MTKILMQYNRWGKVITGGHVYEDNLFRWLKEDGVEIDRRSADAGMSRMLKLFYPLVHLRLLRHMRDYDLIVFNSVCAPYFLPLLWALRLTTRKKTVAIHHHFMNNEFKGLKHYFYRFWEHTFLKSAHVILTPSPYILSLCQQHFPRKKAICLPIPFTTDEILNARPQKGALVYVGTVEPRKGLVYLIEALTELKKRGHDYTLTIIGKTIDAGYKTTLDRMITDADIKVRFTGFIDMDEKKEILSAADVFVFPSMLEGYGMVLCEAMACGLPVVCFDNSAMPFTVHSGDNGILVPNKDSMQFADAVERIVEDRTLREKLSKGARSYAATLLTPATFRLKAKDLFLTLAKRDD